ncbi:MAG TPA: hypothetical protein VG929_08080 [Actinomycetota bacterium]|nr:hypothetical protein [Actinomycetota bacterium]
MERGRRALVSLCAAGVMAAGLLPVAAQAAPQPSDQTAQVVVWAMNTGNNSKTNCAKIGGCNQDLFSKRMQSAPDCPDVMLAQEIRSIAQANSLKRELDQIGGACGTYRRYFYDANPSSSTDTKIGKVAVAWRYDRFELAKTAGGAFDALNFRERWNELNNEDREICDRFTTNGPKDQQGNHTPGTPSRYVSAVKLIDKKHADKAIVAASIHWDGAMSQYCFHENSREFARAIEGRWPGVPVAMGGDHNTLAWTSTDWVERRREAGARMWHRYLTDNGYQDVIRSTYSNAADVNGDGNIDMCEQYTSGIHTDHSKAVSNRCEHEKHSRIDYLWGKYFSSIVYARTDKAHYGRHQSGNYYADHRPVTTRLAY